MSVRGAGDRLFFAEGNSIRPLGHSVSICLVLTNCHALLWCWGCNSEKRPGGIPILKEHSVKDGRAAKRQQIQLILVARGFCT